MDISSLNNYFELYGGMAIFIVVLLEYMNLPGFPAGIIMPDENSIKTLASD